jgi:hypothetical protein
VTDGYDVQRSTDNGQNWTQTSLNDRTVRSLAVSGSNVFAGTSSGVYLSTNNGETWSQINEGMGNREILSLAMGPNYIYAGTNGASVWRLPLSQITGIEDRSNEIPSQFILSQNYPNPFNPSTVISYQLAVGSHVTLKVYDVLGKEVATLVNEEKPAGNYKIKFNAGSLSSGIYFYTLKATPIGGQAGNPETSSGQGFAETKKLILLR